MVMETRKFIRKIGDSIGIIINKEERQIYDIKQGDVVTVSIKKEEKQEWY